MPNLDPESYPDPFYIFVDQANATTYNNFNTTGQFCSAAMAAAGDPATWADYADGRFDFLPFIPNPQFAGFLSPFVSDLITAYRVEYDAEQARRVHAPEAPSRLSAVFAFGSYAECEEVSQTHGWPLAEVKEFKPVTHPLLRAELDELLSPSVR